MFSIGRAGAHVQVPCFAYEPYQSADPVRLYSILHTLRKHLGYAPSYHLFEDLLLCSAQHWWGPHRQANQAGPVQYAAAGVALLHIHQTHAELIGDHLDSLKGPRVACDHYY